MSKIDEFIQELKNKRIAIIGLGVSNIPLMSYFTNLNLNIVLFDKKNKNELNKDIIELIDKYNIECYLGENYLDNLTGFDYIFRSPSILPTNPYIEKEKNNGAIITTEIEQVIKLSPCKIIGVTGSKGKTTKPKIINKI